MKQQRHCGAAFRAQTCRIEVQTHANGPETKSNKPNRKNNNKHKPIEKKKRLNLQNEQK